MLTTLDIDDDVLAAAEELARQQNLSADAVISSLLRQALAQKISAQPAMQAVGGFNPFPSRGVAITNEQVNAIRDREGI